MILVEGTSGAGKTTLVRALAARLGVEPVLQKRTYGPIAPLEDAGTLDDATNRAFLERFVAELASDAVIDTLHLTQRVRPGVLSQASFDGVDARLAARGAKLVFVTASPEALWKRVIEVRRGTGFRAYATRFASTEEGVHRWLLEQQERQADLLDATRLPVLRVTGVQPVDVLAEGVIAWAGTEAGPT